MSEKFWKTATVIEYTDHDPYTGEEAVTRETVTNVFDDRDKAMEAVDTALKELREEANDDDDYNGTLLRNYAVTSIVVPEDCDNVYDVMLAPLPRPGVSLRIRKQDLRKLVLAMETTDGDWYLNLDTGELSSGRGCVDQVVSAQMDGEDGLHFYGRRSEEQEGDE